MPLPLNLFKALEKGEPVTIDLVPNDTPSPPKGRVWLILSGTIDHNTGTLTILDVRKNMPETTISSILWIPAAIATMQVPLFSVIVQAAGVQAQWTPIIVEESEHLRFVGDAANVAHIKVLEWTP